MMKLEDFLAVFTTMREVQEHEFRNAGCQGAAPHRVSAEDHFNKQWHLYRSNPHLWLARAEYTEATQFWGILMDKVDFEAFRKKRDAERLA